MMGICYIDRNAGLVLNYAQIPCLSSGFSISQNPSLGIAVQKKNQACLSRLVKPCKCRAINAVLKSESEERTIDGRLVENEFGFTPSFGEHLKVMQSVIVKRKKRNDRNSGASDTPLLDKDEKVTGSRGGNSDKEIRKKAVVEKSDVGSYDNGFVRPSKKSETNTKTKQTEEGYMKSEKWVKDRSSSTSNRVKSNLSKNARLQCIDRISIEEDKIERRIPIRDGHPHDENVGEVSFGVVKDKLKWQRLVKDQRVSINLEVNEKYVRNHDQAKQRTTASGKSVVPKKRLSTKSGAYAREFDSEYQEPERAAFKNFDTFNIMDRPRVTKMQMEERIQKLAYQLNCVDIDIPEWTFSKMIRSAEIRFSDYSIARIIHVLGKLGNWKRALQVIDWYQMRERFKSHNPRYIYNAALDVLGKAGRPVEALNLFHVMQRQMSSYPDLLAYHSISVTLGQAGHVNELFDVIDCMRSLPTKKFETGLFENWDPRLEPDAVVYNAVLNACAQRKQWEGANWVLKQFNEQGLQPSCTTYGLVMEVMFACGKYDMVHEFFKEVQKSSNPNALTYKVLVNTLWRQGKTDEAVVAVQDMERLGIVGSASLYYDLARCLCSAGRCRQALMLIEKICRVATKPLLVTYTGLIQACLESNNIHDGAYIFSKMHKFCRPNLATYNIMLKGYVQNGMFEEAKQLFLDMSKDEKDIQSISDYKERVLPDTFTFNTMLDICFAEKRWEDFSFFYMKMLHHGYPFNAKQHLSMILDASRSGKGELLETTWNHLTRTDQIRPIPLMLERFCTKLEETDYSAAISCITTTTPRTNIQPFTRKAWLNLLKENTRRYPKETLSGLIQELTIFLGKSDPPDPALRNLLSSCQEFVSMINFTESIRTISSRTYVNS